MPMEKLPAMQKPKSSKAEIPRGARRNTLPGTANITANSPAPEIATGARTMGSRLQPLTSKRVAVDCVGGLGIISPVVAVAEVGVIDAPW